MQLTKTADMMNQLKSVISSVYLSTHTTTSTLLHHH